MAGLAQKVALVTGSTSGIGRGIVEHFAARGARVVVHGRRAQQAEEIADRLRAGGHDAAAVAADLAKVDDCRRAVRFTIERFGRIDVLVNNAALTTRGYLEDVAVEVWDTIMHVNLRAPFICLQEAVRSMKTNGGGSIVNIGSVNAYIGEPKLGPYSVSKGGLMTLTRNAAATLNRYRIRVNQINVGWTLTEGEERVKRDEEHDPDWLEKAIKTRPFGRLLTPNDIAVAVDYFASDASECVTGAVMDLEQYPVGAPPNW
ncbi:MAG: glucose 1-dehydrogenase [Acidobacteria bacterium]|nr:glucose 1-dehydrogenase [Acidobacteriota bacterium]